jgi:hypothetical protein
MGARYEHILRLGRKCKSDLSHGFLNSRKSPSSLVLRHLRRRRRQARNTYLW